MANFLTSSIGKKFIQSVSGAFLIIFLLLHGTINFFSVLDSLHGNFGKVADDAFPYTHGDGWFQLGCDFMSSPFIKLMVPVLALGFVIHIVYGCWLSYENIKKRGGVKRYEVASKAKSDSWSAKNMAVLGIIILGLLAFHLTHFWAKMQLQEFMGNEAENPYYLLMATFRNPVVLGCYIIWFIALFLHLNHGFWSMFQTIGWNNKKWLGRLKVIGTIVAALIVLMFVATAVNAYIEAHCVTASAQWTEAIIAKF
ncbi:MAG: succinate dehydrogenase cytochrome b subunit [Bacteroidales bacterium]|jgi:succinate dehydrogenase / fumarate reductase cytochrome b subunit|nr:succinate dehydrogenase cytochrome b subunit [Bacteroidales bacterium]